MKFSNDKAKNRFEAMCTTAQKLATEMDEWSQKFHGIELTLTETKTTAEEDHKLARTSDTHRTGRAFDVRTKDLPEWFVKLFLEHFRFLYNDKLGAIGKEGPNLIYDKPHGSGPHWHVQVKRGSK